MPQYPTLKFGDKIFRNVPGIKVPGSDGNMLDYVRADASAFYKPLYLLDCLNGGEFYDGTKRYIMKKFVMAEKVRGQFGTVKINSLTGYSSIWNKLTLLDAGCGGISPGTGGTETLEQLRLCRKDYDSRVYIASSFKYPALKTFVSAHSVYFPLSTLEKGGAPNLTDIVIQYSQDDSNLYPSLVNATDITNLAHFGATDKTGKIWVADDALEYIKTATNWSTLTNFFHPLSEYTGWQGETLPENVGIRIECTDGSVIEC